MIVESLAPGNECETGECLGLELEGEVEVLAMLAVDSRGGYLHSYLNNGIYAKRNTACCCQCRASILIVISLTY